MKPNFIIFSGYNERAVLAFLRHLTKNKIPYTIIAASPEDRIFSTIYKDSVVYIRKNTDLNFTTLSEIFIYIRSLSHDDYFYAPTTESLNRVILSYKDELEKIGIHVPLTTQENYKLISDKYSFYCLCKNKHITVPKEILNPHKSSLPFVAKPKSYGEGSYLKPILIFNEQDRKALLQSKQLDMFFFQEFVFGRSIYYLLYLDVKREYTAFSQENLIQQPHGKSIIAATATEHWKEGNCNQYISLLRDIGFRGLIMIEVCQAGNEFYMIEANPRFWGPSQLFVDTMNENLFSKFIYDWSAISTQSYPIYQADRYYWHEGLLETIQSGETPVFHNYTKENFFDDIPKWIEFDIYRRYDTRDIFLQQIKLG